MPISAGALEFHGAARRDEDVEALEGVAGLRPDVEAVHAARRLGARGGE